MYLFFLLFSFNVFASEFSPIVEETKVKLKWIEEPIQMFTPPGTYSWKAAVEFNWNGFKGRNIFYIQKIQIKKQIGPNYFKDLSYWEVFPNPKYYEPFNTEDFYYVRDTWRFISGIPERRNTDGYEKVWQSEGYLIQVNEKSLEYMKTWKSITESASSPVSLKSPYEKLSNLGTKFITGPLEGRYLELEWNKTGKTTLIESKLK